MLSTSNREPGCFGIADAIAAHNRRWFDVSGQDVNSSTTTNHGRFENADAASLASTFRVAPVRGTVACSVRASPPQTVSATSEPCS
jgi:hypothetical protein